MFLDTGDDQRHATVYCQSVFYNLRSLPRIRKFTSSRHCEISIHAFVRSKLDHCNSISDPKTSVCAKSCCGHLLTGKRKHDHITAVWQELHWLPIADRINLKILLITLKPLDDIVSFYLKELVIS